MKHLSRGRIYRRFGADDEPALVAQLGETLGLVIETGDRFRGLTESDFPGNEDSLINTMNGPVYIDVGIPRTRSRSISWTLPPRQKRPVLLPCQDRFGYSKEVNNRWMKLERGGPKTIQKEAQ